MSEKILDGYLHSEALAAQLGIGLRTLYRWQARGIGPPKTKIGGKVLYHAEAVRRWLKANESGPVRDRKSR